ncbi:hypothetical protein V6N11_003820 [Hibiscus sabdariffa]|uniref:Uncharacterized protein n=1 Tax=Hibiscus sabdariffa TaxID=183260 RepID=A0ABR2SEF4_9ROSI
MELPVSPQASPIYGEYSINIHNMNQAISLFTVRFPKHTYWSPSNMPQGSASRRTGLLVLMNRQPSLPCSAKLTRSISPNNKLQYRQFKLLF